MNDSIKYRGSTVGITGKRLISLLLSFVMVLFTVLACAPAETVRAESAYYDLVCFKDDPTNLSDKMVSFNDMSWYIIKDESTAVNAGEITMIYAGSITDIKIEYGEISETMTDFYKANFTEVGDALMGSGAEDKLFLLDVETASNMPVQIKTNPPDWWLKSDVVDGKVKR